MKTPPEYEEDLAKSKSVKLSAYALHAYQPGLASPVFVLHLMSRRDGSRRYGAQSSHLMGTLLEFRRHLLNFLT